MEATIYTQDGKQAGSVTLSKDVFGLPWNSDLVSQVVLSLQSSARDSIAHTKDRSEVRGGGKKPWQQKGLGKARAGSSRSPIWVGGGIAHGPRSDKNYDRKVNRKMKSKALFTMLSQKMRSGEILFVDSLSLPGPKTKDAKKILTSLSTVAGFEKMAGKKKNAVYMGVAKNNEALRKSFNNFGNVAVEEFRNINPLALMQYKYIVIENPKEVLKTLTLENKGDNK